MLNPVPDTVACEMLTLTAPVLVTGLRKLLLVAGLNVAKAQARRIGS